MPEIILTVNAADLSDAVLRGFSANIRSTGGDVDAARAQFDALFPSIDKSGESAKTAGDRMASAGDQMQAAGEKGAGAARGLGSEFSTLEGYVERLTDRLIAYFAVERVAEFIGKVVESGEQIQLAAEKVDVSTDTIQRWKFAAEQMGSTLDSVTRMAEFWGRTLGQNTTLTQQLIAQLGLSAAELRGMSLEESFNAIAEAIKNCPDPILQTEAATKLLGRSAQENLPLIKAGINEVGASATVMSQDTVESLARAERAWKELYNSIVVYTGTAVAGLMDSWHQASNEALQVLGGPLGALLYAVNNAPPDRPAKNISPADADRDTTPARAKAMEDYAASVAKARAEIERLTPAQLADLQAAQELGRGEQELEDKYGLSADAAILLKSTLSQLGEEHKKAAEAAKKHDDAMVALDLDANRLPEGIRAQITALLDQHKSVSEIAEAFKTLGVSEQDVRQIQTEHNETIKQQAADLKATDKAYEDHDVLMGKFVENEEKAADRKWQAWAKSWEQVRPLLAQERDTNASLQQQEIDAIDAEATKRLNDIADQFGEESDLYDLWSQYYAFKKSMALGTEDTIVAQMHAQHLLTVEDLNNQADVFKRQYDAMKEKGVATDAELQAKWQQYIDASNGATDGFFKRSATTWISIKEDASKQFGELEGKVASDFGLMIGHAGSWKTDLNKIVDDIGSYFIGQFDNLLKWWINSFITGMTSHAASAGQSVAKSMSDAAGSAESSWSNAGNVIDGILGSIATAGIGLAVGSLIGAITGPTGPNQALVDLLNSGGAPPPGFVDWFKRVNGSNWQDEWQKEFPQAPIPAAEGMIVTSPTRVLAGEAGYPEIIAPLTGPNAPKLGGDTYHIAVTINTIDAAGLDRVAPDLLRRQIEDVRNNRGNAGTNMGEAVARWMP